MRVRIAVLTMVGVLVVGIGSLGAVANHISAAFQGGHVAHTESTAHVSRTETATYLYDNGDNTACILTDDGNRWWLSAPKIQHDCYVKVSFDDNGTQDVTDDKIVSVSVDD